MVEAGAHRRFVLLLRLTLVMGFAVIVLGSFVRLSNAGLGCPDWPGCYGHLVGVPENASEIESANQDYPQRIVETHKAWKEVIHRYFAGTLGLLALFLVVLSVIFRRRPGQPVRLPVAILVLIGFQALLGMWTVTLQLKPVIVMAHLLGGFATLALLWWLNLSISKWPRITIRRSLGGIRRWANLAAAVLVVQIALGGWTSANYAALACPDFPTCHQQWWPDTDFAEGFILWRGTGINYEFGVLESPARTAIHLTHRIGALVALLIVGALALILRFRQAIPSALRGTGSAIVLLLAAQISLGISNVVFYLPLPVAVAHNAVAAMLLLATLTAVYMLKSATLQKPSERFL